MPGTQLIELAPSILSADFAHLATQVQAAAEGGAAVIHVDVMDGHFVPNITIGPPVVRSLRKTTDLPLDCHLMIEDPDQYIAEFVEAGADWISVHQEACRHPAAACIPVAEIQVAGDDTPAADSNLAAASRKSDDRTRAVADGSKDAGSRKRGDSSTRYGGNTCRLHPNPTPRRSSPRADSY